MPKSLNIKIAEICFCISSRYPILFFEGEKKYQDFLINSPQKPGKDFIHISLSLEKFPPIKRFKKIFDSESSWSLYGTSEHYYIILKPRGFMDPIWCAEFDKSFSNGTVYCGESLVNHEKGVTKVFNPVVYPMDQIILMHFLGQRDGGLIHAGGVVLDDKGFIFPGRSGAGKSTLSKLFLDRKRSDLLSDDRIIVRKLDQQYFCFGTPWPGEAGISKNRKSRLNKIFFIHKAKANKIDRIGINTAFKRIIPVASIPWYHEKNLVQVLNFYENLVEDIPCYDLFFKPEKNIVDVLATMI